MKIFLTYRFTGENFNKLEKILGKIKSILESKGENIFCSLFLEKYFKNKGFSSDKIYKHCLKELNKHDIILFFIKSEKKSKGMELELEQAINDNKRIVLAIQKNLHFSKFRKTAHKIIEYNSLSDLYYLLTKTDLHQ